MKKRLVSFFTSLLMIFSLAAVMPTMSASALQNRSANFVKSYTLTGVGATDMINIAKAQVGRNGAAFGYTEEWCADFVSDCARLAGQSNAIPPNASCYNMMTAIDNAGGDYISASSARPGDLLFYSTSNYPNGGAHVEIVYANNNGILSTIGGNSGNSNNSLSMVKDHKNQNGQPTVYKAMRPNYKSTTPPTNVKLSQNQYWYDITDTVTLYGQADNATNYTVVIDDANGNRLVDKPISGNQYSITTAELGGIGDYYACMIITNSAGGAQTEWIKIPVIGAATYSDVWTSKPIYELTDTVSISVSTVCAKGQVIGIDKEGIGRVVTETCDSTYTIPAKTLGIGKYSAYFSVYNGSGGVDTKKVEFSIAKLDKPNATVKADSSTSITVSWKAITNAKSYRIDRRQYGAEAYETIANVTGTTYTDKGLKPATGYFYRVYAVKNDIVSDHSESVGTYTKLDKPNATVKADSSTSITVSWKAITNAKSYRIDRRQYGGETYETIANVTGTTYTDKGLKPATGYFYRVYAVKNDIVSDHSESVGTYTKLDKPNATVKADSSTSITVSWKAITNAKSYRIDRRQYGGETYETIANVTGTTYTDKGLKPATGYFYRVYAVKNDIISDRSESVGTYTEKCTHSYDSGKITKAADCTTDGEKIYTCKICGITKTETISKIGHTAVTDPAVAATCVTAGRTEGSHCSKCNTVIKAQTTIASTGHSYNSWTTTKSATCTEDGTQTRKCTVCGNTETKAISKTGHSYTTIWVEPTLNTPGYTVYKCDNCGFESKEELQTVSVSGSVKTFGSDESTPTSIVLTASGSSEILYETTVVGTGTTAYSIPNVVTGGYTLTISKKNHVARTYDITIGSESITQDVEIHLFGDVNGDGRITVSDVAKVNSHIKGKSTLTDYDFAVADVNGDGKLTVSDTAKINAHMRGKNLLW